MLQRVKKKKYIKYKSIAQSNEIKTKKPPEIQNSLHY